MKFFLQFLFLFVAVFPTVIFGIQCAVGGVCYKKEESGFIVDVPIKTCKDACVYFKCFNEHKVGVGCLQDFLNVCKWIPTKYKDEIKENIKNYSLQNEVLFFKSCSDKDGCATNGLKSWSSDNVSFNIGSVYHSYNSTCRYVEDEEWSNQYANSTSCVRELKCAPGKLYFANERNSWWFWLKQQGSGHGKDCDGCLEFKCTNDGGNTVIKGSGCFDDLVYACPTVPDDVKEKIKKNINDSFYFDKNYVVTSCNSEKFHSCSTGYVYFNSLAEKIFNANVNITFDKFCSIEFNDSPIHSTTTLPQNSSHGQANVFKICGIFIAFFALVLFHFL